MTRRNSVGLVLATCLVGSAAPALAARGIITNKPNSGGGTAGRILVTYTVQDSTSDVSQVRPGFRISFTEDVARSGIAESDLVSFDVLPGDPATGGECAVNIRLLTRGRLIVSPQECALRINPDEVVLVRSTEVAGKISIHGGILAVVDGADWVDAVAAPVWNE